MGSRPHRPQSRLRGPPGVRSNQCVDESVRRRVVETLRYSRGSLPRKHLSPDVFVQESDRYRLVDLDTTSRGSRTGRRRRRASELAPGRGRLRRYRSHTAPAAAVGVLGDSSVHWKLAFEQCLSEVRAPVDLDGRLLAPGDDRYWNPLSHGLRFGLVPCCCFERDSVRGLHRATESLASTLSSLSTVLTAPSFRTDLSEEQCCL